MVYSSVSSFVVGLFVVMVNVVSVWLGSPVSGCGGSAIVGVGVLILAQIWLACLLCNAL